MLRIATRRSALARAQAFQTGRQLEARTGTPFTLVPLATTGDLAPDRAIGAFDTKGLFVDTIRQAVLDGECDLAVHSAKDLPSAPADGLTIAAVPARADPRDVLVTAAGHTLAVLPDGARVGTSSERRRAQLLRARPGLDVVGVRGNLDTRLGKVAAGQLDAVVVAAAGLGRLYVPEEEGGAGPLDLPVRAVPLEPGECLPAAGQGALAVECRADDRAALDACGAVDDAATHAALRAERAFLARLGGGCLAPVGALATAAGTDLTLAGMVAEPAGGRILRLSETGRASDPEALGERLADRAAEAGGQDLIAAAREAATGGTT